ncbi:MAG: Na(+)-translocating NADH-quinone reductase subunit C [Chlamydiia bacterium]|nr:Na(+)-translocating NADH-quinone reductase subunit C [Chlamydiia bacterium]
MCSISAFILSIISFTLKPAQIKSQASYRNKELLKAANLLPTKASSKQIDIITKEKIMPLLTDENGNTYTFAEKNIDYSKYLEDGAKSGYSKLPFKLYYKIKNGGIILPVNGFGLWDAIYGYIGIDKNGFTIIGISWYEQKETPGLGGEIQNPKWQEQFKGKSLFHGSHMKTFGLNLIPKEMLAMLPLKDKEYSIDAISGATITSHGVQHAIKDSLTPYIPLLRKMQKQ